MLDSSRALQRAERRTWIEGREVWVVLVALLPASAWLTEGDAGVVKGGGEAEGAPEGRSPTAKPRELRRGEGGSSNDKFIGEGMTK